MGISEELSSCQPDRQLWDCGTELGCSAEALMLPSAHAFLLEHSLAPFLPSLAVTGSGGM